MSNSITTGLNYGPGLIGGDGLSLGNDLTYVQTTTQAKGQLLLEDDTSNLTLENPSDLMLLER